MSLTVITPPAEPVIALEDALDFLRMGHDGEAALVTDLVKAATARLEAASGLSLVTRTLSRKFRQWPATLSGIGFILRPKPVLRLRSVVSVADDGTEEDVTSRFQLHAGRLVVRPWSVAPAISRGGTAVITFDSGFGSAATVPEDLKLAVLQLVAEAYRTGRTELDGDAGFPPNVAGTILAYREFRV
ncbi:MAG: hypothetical protein AAGJ32_00200 [Pseudomonadota bacterium]